MLTWHAQWQLLQSSFRLASHNFDAAFFPSLLLVAAIASTLLAVAFAVAPLFEFTDFSTPVVLGVVTAIHLDFALLLLTIPSFEIMLMPVSPSPLLASLPSSLFFPFPPYFQHPLLIPFSPTLPTDRVLLSVSVLQTPSPLLPSLSITLCLLRRYSHAYLALIFGLLRVLSSLAAACSLTPSLTQLHLFRVPSLPQTYPPSPPNSPSLPTYRVLLSVSVQTPSPLLPSLSMTLRLLRRYSHAYLALNFGLLGVLSSLAAACFLLTGFIQNVMLHNLMRVATPSSTPSVPVTPVPTVFAASTPIITAPASSTPHTTTFLVPPFPPLNLQIPMPSIPLLSFLPLTPHQFPSYLLPSINGSHSTHRNLLSTDVQSAVLLILALPTSALILACLFSAVVLHAVASTLFVSLALHQMGSIRLPRAF
ncbi:unnamed protein product [Closterium sp. Yama58-4]|nr:unnamed protein product [Closterium sp. Yama58-4]